jgi:hypothetical protein
MRRAFRERESLDDIFDENIISFQKRDNKVAQSLAQEAAGSGGGVERIGGGLIKLQ